MTREEIRQRMEEVAARHGRWTADNIRLADELYTLGPARRPPPGRPYTGQEGVDPRVRCLLQTAADLLGQPLAELRVLDLAPGEGQRAAEFALHGAHVTVLEAGANREKLAFLKEVFGDADLGLRKGDVSRLHPDEFGAHDVVLCAGVLDRLDVTRLFPTVQRVAQVCRRLVLIDTHVSLADREAYVHHGRVYWGRTIAPLPTSGDGATPAGSPFWLTRPSLLNLLRHVGFTSVVECLSPMGYVFADRHLFAALKGQRQTIHTAPLLNEPEDDWPEKVPLSAAPKENADCYHPNADLLAHCQHLQGEYEKLHARHQSLTHLGGLLRHLPRACWQAVRRRLPGAGR